MLCSATFWSYELRFFNKHYYFHRRRPHRSIHLSPSRSLLMILYLYYSIFPPKTNHSEKSTFEPGRGELFLLPTAVGFLLCIFPPIRAHVQWQGHRFDNLRSLSPTPPPLPPPDADATS